jgi:sortase (surface protein transpeptidase)
MTRGRLAIGAVALALLLAGCTSASAGNQGSEPGGGVSAPGKAKSGADAARNFKSETTYQGTPEPVRVEIPRIGVSSGLRKLGKKKDGTVNVDPDALPWGVAGWYTGSPRPGDPGSAVIMGHVDSKASGPAVFYRLRELRPGDQIQVTRADGSVVRFAVDRTAQYPKANFPTDEVYYPTLQSELRLITCGGSFDNVARHYRSNIIVFAKLER